MKALCLMVFWLLSGSVAGENFCAAAFPALRWAWHGNKPGRGRRGELGQPSVAIYHRLLQLAMCMRGGRRGGAPQREVAWHGVISAITSLTSCVLEAGPSSA